MSDRYDALLVASFGGPERPEDVLPFLENVTRGKNVPTQRLEEVAAHYALFGGVSPINGEIRALLTALVGQLNAEGPPLAVYWGNRFWHPLLADALGQMADDGVTRALAFATSAFGSYPGCRAYVEDIERARAEVGPRAPQVDKIRPFYNHPGFIEPSVDRTLEAFGKIPAERRQAARLIFTAHSLPLSMARTSPYQEQLGEACRLVAEQAERAEWDLAFQSRSGPPRQPWLEPDLGERLLALGRAAQAADVVIMPIGFVCEHMELVYDLDVEVAALCEHLGVNMVRARTVASHPRFVQMIRELIIERIDENAPRLALGSLGPGPDRCPDACCPPPGPGT